MVKVKGCLIQIHEDINNPGSVDSVVPLPMFSFTTTTFQTGSDKKIILHQTTHAGRWGIAYALSAVILYFGRSLGAGCPWVLDVSSAGCLGAGFPNAGCPTAGCPNAGCRVAEWL